MSGPVFKNQHQMRQLGDADLAALHDKHLALARKHLALARQSGRTATYLRHARILDAISAEIDARRYAAEAFSPYGTGGIRIIDEED